MSCASSIFVDPNEERRRGAKARKKEKRERGFERRRERGRTKREGSKVWRRYNEVAEPTTLRKDACYIEERRGTKVFFDASARCLHLHLWGYIATDRNGTATDLWRKISESLFNLGDVIPCKTVQSELHSGELLERWIPFRNVTFVLEFLLYNTISFTFDINCVTAIFIYSPLECEPHSDVTMTDVVTSHAV